MQILSKSLLNVKTGVASILRYATNAEPFIDEGELVGDSFGVLLCAVWIDPWGGSEPGRTGAAGRTGECVCGGGALNRSAGRESISSMIPTDAQDMLVTAFFSSKICVTTPFG